MLYSPLASSNGVAVVVMSASEDPAWGSDKAIVPVSMATRFFVIQAAQRAKNTSANVSIHTHKATTQHVGKIFRLLLI